MSNQLTSKKVCSSELDAVLLEENISGSIFDRFSKFALELIKPIVFYFINSKIFLFSSRHFMRLFNPKRDVLVKLQTLQMYANTLDRLLALLFWKYGLVEGYEANIMRGLVQPGMKIVNCGANIGYYTLQFAAWTGATGSVIAFEPDPNSYRLLVKNIKSNGFANIKPVEKAVSNRTGKIQLYYCEENSGDHRIFPAEISRNTINVDAVCLDDYFPRNSKIDLVKMDIQGAEMLALQGMKRVLQENPDIIVISEFCPTLLKRAGVSPEHLIEEFNALGFLVRLIDEDNKQIVSLAPDTLLKLCEKQYYCSIIMTRNSKH